MMKALYARLLKIEGKADEEIARALGVESRQVPELLGFSQATTAQAPGANSSPNDDPQMKAA